MITDVKYFWVIDTLTTLPNQYGHDNVVIRVDYTVTAQELGYRAQSFGTVNLEYNSDVPFINYNDITEEQVWEWINPSIDRSEIEANLQEMINKQKTPEVVTPPLPWSN